MFKLRLLAIVVLALSLITSSFAASSSSATTENIAVVTLKENMSLKKLLVQVYAYRVNFHLSKDARAEQMLRQAARHWRESKQALYLVTKLRTAEQKVLAVALSNAHNQEGKRLANLALKHYQKLAGRCFADTTHPVAPNK